jgi:hypothetical protein
MIPLFVYDLPNWVFGSAVVGAFVFVALVGQFVANRFLPRWFGDKDYNDIVGQYLSAAGVFFGITLGLISVATWENFGAVDTAVANEASSVGVLYRCMAQYPEPQRTLMVDQLSAYVRREIDVAWPKQRQGITPGRIGNTLITRLHADLVRFEPNTEGQKALHAETLHQFSNMAESRRQRLTGVNTHLPSIVWAVVAGGSILNLALMWLLVVEKKSLHYLLNILLATLLGLLVFLLAIMDHPFRGTYSVGPEAFELVYDQMMAK